MKNKFKKLFRQDMGDGRYQKYIKFVKDHYMKEGIRDGSGLTNLIFDDHRGEKIDVIMQKQVRLNEVVVQASQIGRAYNIIWIVYIAAMLFLAACNMEFLPLVMTIVAVSGCFAFKTAEYYSLRCDFADACILACYREALGKSVEKFMSGPAAKDEDLDSK